MKRRSQDRLPADDHGAYMLGRRVFDEAAGKADSVLISCGGYLTFGIIAALERDTGVPVISSNQATLWQALRMANVTEPDARLGRLFTL